MSAAVEVMRAGEATLAELATTARNEHLAAQADALTMVQHAILSGEALLKARARCDRGRWNPFLADIGIDQRVASVYMRMARYADVVLRDEVRSFRQAKLLIEGLPDVNERHPPGPSVAMVECVRQAVNGGMSIKATAEMVGHTQRTIRRWLDPEVDARERAAAQRRGEAYRQKRAKGLEAQRERAIKQAVRKAGVATQEAWSMAERFQDVIAQAQRETEDREARAAFSRAGEHYRKMRDEIVRALGAAT